MAERYDLDRLLKEIQEDEPPESAKANRKLSQEEINRRVVERRERKPDKPAK